MRQVLTFRMSLRREVFLLSARRLQIVAGKIAALTIYFDITESRTFIGRE